MNFYYTERTAPYEALFETPILGLRCKHVMSLSSPKVKALYEASVDIGYQKVLWGYGCGIYEKESENRSIQIHTIREMVYKSFTNPFRLVLDNAGVLWVDNLHSAIRDVFVYGEDIMLKDASFYLVDFTKDIPTIVNRNNCLRDSLSDVKGAVMSGLDRQRRTSDKVREVNYTIREFLKDNHITKDSLNLTKEQFEQYRFDAYKARMDKEGSDD